MIGDLGVPELLVILALVALLFGVGKLGRLGRDLGESVKEFRRAVREDDERPPTPAPGAPASVQDGPPLPSLPATSTEGASRPPSIF
ncbi:MAG: twin-arginine translocase TatA/TatE family subunit [Dehalococcoidia bacterium]|nr:twin-arginine translocase TatA/TatE family subunit [Dehalococcoidia bacterium]